MKFKDYYAALGLSREATQDDIKKAYRKLARKYHPDVSKDPDGEEKFKEVNEAYKTLKDPELRKAYDELGRHAAGEDFKPSPEWGQGFRHAGAGGFEAEHFAYGDGYEDIDLSDLFEELARSRSGFSRHGGQTQQHGTGRQHHPFPIPGQDFEVKAPITLEQAAEGTTLDLHLEMPEFDASGVVQRVPQTFKARIPKGVKDGQKMRLPGKGGKGINGGKDGDLYLHILLKPHPVFRPSEHDLYMDLPVTPWEAALGVAVEVPTLAGPVSLKIPAGISAGRKMRLKGKGLPKPHDGHGDLFAIIQIVVPTDLSEREKSLYQELARASSFNPRVSLYSKPSDQ